MKLAIISSSAPFGKGESFVINEANAIAAVGHEVLLIPTQLRQGNPNRFELHDQVRLYAQASVSLRIISGFFLFALKSPLSLFSLIKMVSDKSLWNSLKNYLVLPKAIWLSGQIKKQHIEHIHAHWLTTSATLAMVTSHLTEIPWSCTAHRGDIVADNLLEKKCASAVFIRFISDSGVKLAKDLAEIPEDKIQVLHLGVGLPEFDKENERPEKQDVDRPFTIVCPANLIPVKGHNCLIEAVAKMQFSKQVQLLLAGDGQLRERLEAKVKTLGVQKHVHFKGHLPHSELLSWYRNRSVDLVVLPSLDLGNGLHEGIPVSLMEAMSFGIPVISTRTGGIPELLEDKPQHRQFGVMVDAGDSEVLAAEMDKMVESSTVRKKWAEQGIIRIQEAFNQQKTIKALLELIKKHRSAKGKV